MKVIEIALKEKKPPGQYSGWWGFVHNRQRYLMRYAHIMLIINYDKTILFQMNPLQRTKTDDAGIKDALVQISDETYTVL